MKGPWRAVKHIEIKNGPRGGRYYDLDLECGHVAFVSIRRTPDLMGFVKGKPIIQTAPYRCQCWHCGQAALKDLPA